MALLPFLASPVLVDPTSTNALGWAGGNAGSGGFAPGYVPFSSGGALYQVLQETGNNLDTPINVYRSTDQGNTWTIMDAAGAPIRQETGTTAGIFFDGSHTIILAWFPTGGAPGISVGVLNLINFDCSMNTWGAVYGTVGSPNVWDIGQLFQRPDGSILVFCGPNNSGGNITGTTAYVYAAGAWSDFACDTNLAAGYTSSTNIAAVMDSTGNIHLFMIANKSANPTEVVYQLVETTNTLGTSAVIQSGSPVNLPGIGGEYEPVVVGNNVIIGLVDSTDSYATIAVGTPLSAPVFTTLGAPGIDPTPPSSVFRFGAPALAADATGIYAVYLYQDGSLNDFYRLAFTPNLGAPLTGWNTSILAFTATDFPGAESRFWDFLAISRVGGTTFVSAMAVPIGGPPFQPSQYWLTSYAPAPAPVQPTTTIGGGPLAQGAPAIISACKRRNDWDWCLLREELRLREICFPPMCNIPEEYRNLLPWDDTFGAIPPQAIPFLRPKGLLTPAPAAGDQVVVSFSLPRGYDGILSGIYQFYTGTGFINGSGDILWRIQLNQRYVKDLSNNPFSLGSPQYPFPMTEGQLLLAGQTVRYIVNVPNLSGQIQVGNSQIVCCLLGFAWPRG